MRLLLPLLGLLLSLSATAQLAGSWYAVLDAMGTKLPLSLELEEAVDGGWQGQLFSPTQTERGIPLDEVTLVDRKLVFTVGALGVRYDGLLDGKSIRGVFNQARVDFSLEFTRYRPDGYPVSEGPVTLRARPQEPRDFPYRRLPVTFPGGADGVSLAGELTLPEGGGKARATVVLLSGSGPQNRDGFLGSEINHSPFLVLSDYLTRRGYAVLRYDDRGVGESGGDFTTATSEDFARDARAAVAFVRGHRALEKVPVGLAGHSEGGMIAPVVAAADGELDFVILLAAPATPVKELMLAQYRLVNESMGIPRAAWERNIKSFAAAYDWVGANRELSQEAYVEGLYDVFEAQLVNLPEPLRKSIKDPRAFNQQFVGAMQSPWFRYFISFDPQEYLSQLTVPTLALGGTNDTQVPALDNLNAVTRALTRAGNEDFRVLPLLGLNHLFQPAETGAPTEYGTIETTFDPAALNAIGEWLGERF